MGQDAWFLQELTIWRANQGLPGTGKAANVAKLGTAGVLPDVCNGGLTPALDSESVQPGDTTTSVGVAAVEGDGEPQPFSITYSDGTVYLSGCVYVGKDYDADAAPYSLAGTLTCNGGYQRNCYTPGTFYATDCENSSGTPPSDCGTLGQDCTNYYQFLAYCSI